MKGTPCRFRGGAWSLGLVLAIGLSNTEPARAGLVIISYGGLNDLGPSEIHVSFPPSPVLVDLPYSNPKLGDAETIVDTALGQIKTRYATPRERDVNGGGGPINVAVHLDDTAHFVGTGTATIRFATVGTGMLPQPDIFNDVQYDNLSTFLTVKTGHSTGQRFSNLPLNGYTVVPPNVPFDFHQVLEETFQVSGTAADPDDVRFIFTLLATGIDGASLNLWDTAQLSIDLSPGVTVTTDGGFTPAAVPEPSTLLLSGPGAILLLCYILRHRRR